MKGSADVSGKISAVEQEHMPILASLDWQGVRGSVERRRAVHERMLTLMRNANITALAQLVVGQTDRAANYSAAHHGLGPRILRENDSGEQRIFELAVRFHCIDSGHLVPRLVAEAGLQHLHIGVGSEMSCMINPAHCWATNRRTIWAHLVVGMGLSPEVAREDERLRAFLKWPTLHSEVVETLSKIAEQAPVLSATADMPLNELRYIWAVAVAERLYSVHHQQR